jgi:hypothetical protein
MGHGGHLGLPPLRQDIQALHPRAEPGPPTCHSGSTTTTTTASGLALQNFPT